MTLDDYQAGAARTREAPFPERERLLVMALGLCGEAGEVADMVKKAAWHGKPLDPSAMQQELGDVLWYLAELATTLGFSLDAIAAVNLEKLQRRYPDGFRVGGGVR